MGYFKNLLPITVLCAFLLCTSCANDDGPITGVPNPTGGGTTDPVNPWDITGSADFPAFPGAQGFGSYTRGGRGGNVIAVTNLNDNGPGSLREACELNGPRIVIFKVGGTIELSQPIQIRDPFITIAGQTAPGDGITLKGVGLDIVTNNVIVRGIRVRVGDDPNGPDPSLRDGISLGTPAAEVTYNIIIDHCSISWAIDENTALNNNVHDVTFQWNIISEGLHFSLHEKGPHSKGMLIGKNNVDRISVHHNYFAHNDARNPKIAIDVRAEVVNNVIYNYGSNATILGPGAEVNAIGNIYETGADTELENNTGELVSGVIIDSEDGSDFLLYVEDNIGPGRLTNSGDEWDVVSGDDAERYRSPEPVPGFNPTGIQEDAVENISEVVLANAGANIPELDPIDQRVIQHFRDKDGSIIDSQNEVGGWVEMSDGVAAIDTDGDGMPDDWEQDQGLNAQDAADGNLDQDNDGYTNIEEYLNQLFEK